MEHATPLPEPALQVALLGQLAAEALPAVRAQPAADGCDDRGCPLPTCAPVVAA